MYTVNDRIELNTETCIKVLTDNGFHILDNLNSLNRKVGVDAQTLVLVNTNEPNDNQSITRDEITRAIVSANSKIYTLYTSRLEKALIAQDYIKLSIGERRKAEDEVTVCNSILNRLILITGIRILILKSNSACVCITNFKIKLLSIDNLEENG